jgi:serine/threonine protein kinase
MSPRATAPDETIDQGGGAAEPDAATASDQTPDMTSWQVRKSQEESLGAPGQAQGFELKEKLGQGGFGWVYLAHDKIIHQRKVAIKFFRSAVGQNSGEVIEEVRRLVELGEVPGIVRYIEVKPDAVPPYYVMTYAEGGSLASRLSREEGRRLREADALRIFREAAEALAVVHVKGIRHCDLKPENILFDSEGHVLLADFGQARRSHEESTALGTFFYMAPEQADLRDVFPDSRWDVYALGVIAYQMLTGHVPHSDPELSQRLRELQSGSSGLTGALDHYRESIAAAPIPDGHRKVRGVGRDLALVIERCLSAQPGKRFQDAGDLSSAIRRLQSKRRERPAQWRNILLLIAALLVSVWMARKEIREARQILVNGTRKDNTLLAKFVADVVEEEILKDRDWIRLQIASDRGLAEAVAGRDVAKIKSFLDRGEIKNGTRELGFNGCTVTDEKGRVLASVGPSSGDEWKVSDPTSDRSFSYREWFNGDQEQDDEKKLYKPLSEPRITRPYRSLDVDGNPKDIGPAISAPIRFRDRTVGVVAAQIPTESISKWIRKVEVSEGFPVLLGDRCAVQYHPKLKSQPDLRVMSSVNEVSGIPAKGKDLIIVAAVDRVLHFRIFDAYGKVVVDTHENKLTEQARKIEDLRKQLASLWPPHELTRSEKGRVITAVRSIVDHKDLSIIEHPGENEHPQGNTKVCKYCEMIEDKNRPARDWAEEPFIDPMFRFGDGKEDAKFTTSFAKMKSEIGWHVLIQREHEKVLAPVENLKRGLLMYGFFGLTVLMIIGICVHVLVSGPGPRSESTSHA